ncbi:MAG: hypothetical protein DRP87_00550 [Spirochaetes bacterium]|nr:MAG: hypothetical protein DRP87_00550 [Spirochaetota bacterium]
MLRKKASGHSLQCVPQLEDRWTTATGTKLSFVVKRFTHATLKGWMWAAENSEEAAGLALKYVPTLDIVHELRTPLNTILGFCQILEEETEQLDLGDS